MSASIIGRIKDVIFTLVFPWLFMSISARQIPHTISTLVSEREWTSLVNPNKFRDALFGHFWTIVGPNVKMNAEVRVIPLLEGRVHQGIVSDKTRHPAVSGRVLEVGAGSGMWADVFLKINTAGSDERGEDGHVKQRKVQTTGAAVPRGISKIFGVEPHPQSVKALRQRVAKLGMQDIYEAIPVGIEQLDDAQATGTATTIEPESIDSIVTVLCLCSIPDQEKNIRALYRLLKPGGRWYVYEHVKVKRGGLLLSLYQHFTNFFWAFFLGSCRLCNDTETHLRAAGAWSNIELVQPPDEPAYKPLPHIIGVLTK